MVDFEDLLLNIFGFFSKFSLSNVHLTLRFRGHRLSLKN